MSFVINLQGDERVIITACIANERWAQQQLYEAFYSPMMGICLRYANNEHEAMDILHEGYIKVFRHIAKYRIGTSLYSWIKRIMVNTAIDYYRKENRRKTENLDHAYKVSSSEPSPLSDLSKKEILAAIQSLSAAYRNVFNLYVIEGYSHREIGTALGISESTSRSNLVKARAKLREILNKRMI
jgi:RNA polymerase sigma-70 factor (ECF subfamily)